jgi:hypothetical protein
MSYSGGTNEHSRAEGAGMVIIKIFIIFATLYILDRGEFYITIQTRHTYRCQSSRINLFVKPFFASLQVRILVADSNPFRRA